MSLPYESPHHLSPEGESAGRSSGNLAFLVRTVRQQDLAHLSEVLASSFHTQDGWGGWLYPLLRAGIYEDIRSRFYSKAPHQACLVAVKQFSHEEEGVRPLHPTLALAVGEADCLVGTVEITLRTPQFYQPRNSHLYLSNLAVKSEFRRQGVAQQLLQTCDRIALDWGFHDLYLHVLENNYQARQLYLKAGYQVQRVETNPLSWLFGRPRQLFLRKHLRD